MDNLCIRCGNSFESDSLDLDLCPECESELNALDNDDSLELNYDDADGWGSDDD